MRGEARLFILALRSFRQLFTGQLQPCPRSLLLLLACGGITRLDQVRTLRKAGYDGFVLGRALLADPNDAIALMSAIRGEPALQRVSEIIKVPVRASAADGSVEIVGADAPQQRGSLEFDA